MRTYYEDGAGGFFAVDPQALQGMGNAVVYMRGATTPGEIGTIQDAAITPAKLADYTKTELTNLPDEWVLAIGLDQPAQPAQPAQTQQPPRPRPGPGPRPRRPRRVQQQCNARPAPSPEVEPTDDLPQFSLFSCFIAVAAIAVWVLEFV